MSKIKYEKLTRDKEKDTVIIAGKEKIPVSDLEKGGDSEIKRKLKGIESELEKY